MHGPTRSLLLLCLLIPLTLNQGCMQWTTKTLPPILFSSPEEALKGLDKRLPVHTGLQALADVQMISGNNRYPLKLAILVKRPASLRVEAIPFIGLPGLYLSVRDRTLKVFLADRQAFFIGQATLDNIARYLPLKIDPTDMIALLMGSCPALPRDGGTLTGSMEGDFYRIDGKNGERHQSLWIRRSNGFLERCEMHQNHKQFYEVRFEEPLLLEEAPMPRKITILSEGDDRASYIIRYSDMQLLKDTDPVAFDLNVPTGITPVRLE